MINILNLKGQEILTKQFGCSCSTYSYQNWHSINLFYLYNTLVLTQHGNLYKAFLSFEVSNTLEAVLFNVIDIVTTSQYRMTAMFLKKLALKIKI